MLVHDGEFWHTECHQCSNQAIEIVGEPDQRGKRVDLAKAAEFLASPNWSATHRGSAERA